MEDGWFRCVKKAQTLGNVSHNLNNKVTTCIYRLISQQIIPLDQNEVRKMSFWCMSEAWNGVLTASHFPCIQESLGETRAGSKWVNRNTEIRNDRNQATYHHGLSRWHNRTHYSCNTLRIAALIRMLQFNNGEYTPTKLTWVTQPGQQSHLSNELSTTPTCLVK